MHNRNTFEGIRYRVQETLSKQPNGVPLTAREVAQRLHENEYRGELFDTVLHRVTTALQALYNKGVVNKQPHTGGYSTYTLTVRTTFTPPPGIAPTPPANPVIPPALAAKVIESLKPAPPKPKAPHPLRSNVVPGSQDRVFEFVKASEGPVTVNSIAADLRDLYAHMNDQQAKAAFTGHLTNLWKKKRIKRTRATGGGKGVRYAYFHHKRQLDAIAAPAPAPAAKATTLPPPGPIVRVPAAAPRFRPIAESSELVLLKLAYTEEKLATIDAAAKRFGVTTEAFCQQAIDFAMANADA